MCVRVMVVGVENCKFYIFYVFVVAFVILHRMNVHLYCIIICVKLRI